ncbi:SHOCT domain-containing protein [Candidatus Soleaferrea massiliensis]|uniref:SHOCT domain-containing protein n=1 Tax=Candidatus Soleaferrea massiliensis TaxID=1470354 RepID=UPI00058BA13A|nr:SHOCT domain-containing protein [Candidatus Soleaferrea massiliensis]
MNTITMTAEQFDREKNYGAAISLAKTLLFKGLITEKEYDKIDKILIGKYRPIISGLRVKLP